MKITLRDPIGQSVELDASPAEILAVSNTAKSHLISPTETHNFSVKRDIIFVDDVISVLTDYVEKSKNPN